MSQTANKLSILQKIEQTPATQIPNLPEVADRFKQLFTLLHRQNGNVRYEAEKFHFMKQLQEKPELQQCTKLSLYGCFLDCAVNGLSFDPTAKQVYIVSFNVNVGTKTAPQWEKRATLMVSGIGELSMRIRQGQIRYADNPVLVYEGDFFKCGTRNDKYFIEHEAAIPRKSDNIIAAYIRLERMDGSSDYKVLTMDEVQKLRKFSKDPNSKAWTDGLPGMIQSKVIKHAFRTYPRLQAGNFTELSSNLIDAPATEAPMVIDYGLNGSTPTPISAAQEARLVANDETPSQAPQSAPAPAQGVVDDTFDAPQAPAPTVTHVSDEF